MEDKVSNLCSCGCGYKVGSSEFIRLHVESDQEAAQREACEQEQAEREAMEDYYNELDPPHNPLCFCTKCDG